MGNKAKNRTINKQKSEKRTRIFALLGLCFGSGSVAYEMMAPNPNIYIGSFAALLSVCFFIAFVWVFVERKVAKMLLAAIVLGLFAWFDYGFIVESQVPSFAYIKPGVALNEGHPNPFWIFFLTNRGYKALYNVGLYFEDVDRRNQVNTILQKANGSLSAGAVTQLVDSESISIRYEELDPSVVGKLDEPEAQVQWAPVDFYNQHYDIIIRHRAGAIRENLEVAKIDGKWAYAMVVKIEGARKKLIYCRDSLYPASSDFPANLPSCWPDFPNLGWTLW